MSRLAMQLLRFVALLWFEYLAVAEVRAGHTWWAVTFALLTIETGVLIVLSHPAKGG